MATFTQTQQHLSMTRAQIVDLASEKLAVSLNRQRNEVPSTIKSRAASLNISAHQVRCLKALARYELGTSLSSYDDGDLVFASRPGQGNEYEYLALEEYRVCRRLGNGDTDAEDALRRDQGPPALRYVPDIVLPEKGKKVLQIRNERGEAVQAVSASVARRSTGGY